MKTKATSIICFCNSIRQDKIEAAVKRGCRNLNAVMNATTAGLGQCGGSCRPDLETLLRQYQETGEFPQLRPKR